MLFILRIVFGLSLATTQHKMLAMVEGFRFVARKILPDTTVFSLD